MSAAKKFILGILLMLGSTACQAATLGQIELLERTNVMTAKVIRFAEQQSQKFGAKQLEGKARTQLIVEIEGLLGTESNPAVLARVALVTRALLVARQESGQEFDEIISIVLDEAWFGCIKNITRAGGAVALVALNDIKRTMVEQTPDGVNSLALRQAIEQVARTLKRIDTKKD